jgi:hypothetical protein
VVFDLNGTVPASHVQGNEVAFLVLSDIAQGNVANIRVRSLAAAPVPEPSSFLLLATGALSYFGARRRKR